MASTIFSAASSADGYLYQIRFALLVLLRAARSDPSVSIRIEGLDDIEVQEKAGTRLVQTKHHSGLSSTVSDRSADLWKSIRIWSEAVASEPSLLDGSRATIFALVTTAHATNGTAIESLREPTLTKAQAATTKLTSVAQLGGNKANAAGYAAFLALRTSDRLRLLSSVRLLDNSIHNIDVFEAICNELRFSVTGKPQQERLTRELEGWWNNRVSVHFVSTDDYIGADEVQRQIRDTADALGPDALPIDPSFADTPVHSGIDEMLVFVAQLRLCDCGDRVVLAAIRDFLRATSQIAKWTREDLLPARSLDEYRSRLVDEWEQLYAFLLDRLENENDAQALRQAGNSFYQEMMKRNIPIRPNRAEPFLMRGSLHALANERRVGWHPRYRDHLS